VAKYVDKRHGPSLGLGIAATVFTIEGPEQLYSKSCRSAGIVRKVLEMYWSCTGTAGDVPRQLELYMY
jgi:hypothetical protein